MQNDLSLSGTNVTAPFQKWPFCYTVYGPKQNVINAHAPYQSEDFFPRLRCAIVTVTRLLWHHGAGLSIQIQFDGLLKNLSVEIDSFFSFFVLPFWSMMGEGVFFLLTWDSSTVLPSIWNKWVQQENSLHREHGCRHISKFFPTRPSTVIFLTKTALCLRWCERPGGCHYATYNRTYLCLARTT